MTFLKNVGAFIVAVLVTYVVAAIAATSSVLASGFSKRVFFHLSTATNTC